MHQGLWLRLTPGRSSAMAGGGVLAPAIRRLQHVFALLRQLSGGEPEGRAVETVDHGEARDFASKVRVQELGIVAKRHAAVRLAVRAQHVGVGEDAVAAVHPAPVDGIEANGANAMKQSLAQSEMVHVGRLCPPLPRCHWPRLAIEAPRPGLASDRPPLRQVTTLAGMSEVALRPASPYRRAP